MNRKLNVLSGCAIVQSHKTNSKDLPEIGIKNYEPTCSWFEENKLNNAIDERYTLIKEPRIEKDSVLSVAKWDSGRKKVVVVKKKGKEWETYGYHDSSDNLDYLTPEEALFLLESNSLILMNGSIEVSIESSYSLLLSPESGCTIEQYRVFSHLSKLGYKLIRHKKLDAVRRTEKVQITNKSDSPTSSKVSVNQSHKVGDSKTDHSDVVLINDSSTDLEEDEDVVIIDVIRSRHKEVIDLDDEESRDSDLVVMEVLGLEELPLENWSFVHRKKFLESKNGNNDSVRIDSFIVSQMELEILDDIPNVKGRKSWLYRPDERLLPDGIWPFHYKYLIDLNIEKNEYNGGRGGFRGRFFRGRGWYLKRQVNQMKNYTISLMNMVSQLMGSQGLQVLPPPPALIQGHNHRYQRGDHFRGRVSWGRISLTGRGACYRPTSCNNGDIITQTVILSDDEETLDDKASIKIEDNEEDDKASIKIEDNEEDVKPKRIKLEHDTISLGSNGSVKIEPSVKEEIDVKIEPVAVIKDEIKTESTKNKGDNDVCKEQILPESVGIIVDENVRNTSLENTTCLCDTSRVSETEVGSNMVTDDISTGSELHGPVIVQGKDCFSPTEKVTPDTTESTVFNLDGSSSASLDVVQLSKEVKDLIKPQKYFGENLFGHCDETDQNNEDNLVDPHPSVTNDSYIEEETNEVEKPIGNNSDEKLQFRKVVKQKCTSKDTPEPMIIDVDSYDRTDVQNYICEVNSLKSHKQDNRVETNWKHFKETENTCFDKVERSMEEVNPTRSDENKNEELDFGSPLIDSEHCSSIESVLKRLQIFEEYRGQNVIDENHEINVCYDVYLPSSPYYRNLPPEPDLRLIILRLDDNFPNADQMINLRKTYNDKKGFLFAVILRESIAYYLYDHVCLPFNNEN